MPRHDPPEADETETLRQTISLLELRLEQDRSMFAAIAKIAQQHSSQCKACEAIEVITEEIADMSRREPQHDSGIED